MAQLDPKRAIIRKQVQSVEFGLYTDQEVIDRSVVQITCPQVFDPNGTALPAGLYDPRLGPIDRSPCVTCASLQCPGHWGHIQLQVPVYQPILFPQLLHILRAKCWACHKFKAERRPLQIWSTKHALWRSGQLTQAKELDESLSRIQHSAKEQVPINASQTIRNQAAAHALDAYLQALSATRAAAHPTLLQTSAYKEYYRDLIRQGLSLSKKSAKCQSCGASSPKIRHDAFAKIFQAPLTSQQSKLNAAEGVTLQSALEQQQQDGYNSDDTNRQDMEDMDDSDDEEEEEDDDEDDMKEDDEVDDEEEEDDLATAATSKKKRDKYLHPGEVEAQLKRTWEQEPFLCNALFGCSGDLESTTDYQFYLMRVVPVPPSRFRPPMHLGDMAVEHGQTQYLSSILQLHESVGEFFQKGNAPRAYSSWIELQTVVNCFMDSSRDPSGNTSQVAAGIKQLLERKEGLFRKNMMGKRVDYACRSVISPDPYVGTNEIGLPHYFASILTYPTPVTDWNAREMRQMVERGPHNYPGARWVEMDGRRMDLSKMDAQRREAIAAQLLTHAKQGMPALVGRQLKDGDYVLMNRQPTLHKPGIMAHRVRVLYNRNQRTIRMHYANCNTYNADFDGDEMNCHYPQNDVARAEAQYIASTEEQYIVPTDGSPLRGLIQDHVVGGVKLTKRDTFLKKWEFQQLLFAALSSLDGLEVIRSDAPIRIPPPAILKPTHLWTGKQVVSALLSHISQGNDSDDEKHSSLPGISCERKSKTPETAFGKEQEEHLVLIRDGELLRGVLDKAAFGSTDFSLVHAVQEAYGGAKAGLLLNTLGRLFTAYIQYYSGHSCRMEDLMLTDAADDERRRMIDRAYNVGARAAKAWADSEGGKLPILPIEEQEDGEEPLNPAEAASAAAKIGELLSGTEGKENFASLDGFMQGQLNPLSSAIVKKSLPNGLEVPFPYNTFGVMTTTGAKGSIVNQSQVTCALGQQALEGRRVPRMSCGRTLPSFSPYDPNPRADGFVMDRFLTGIRPQEYYFHCMAGREGLVDTAVKTSRSGYLQRCLVKHLEELKICYDFTVRNSENSVVQFLYGEDGLDPTKAAYLDCRPASFEYMARNHESLSRRNKPLPSSSIDVAAADCQAATERMITNKAKDFNVGDTVKARRLRDGCLWARGKFLQGWHDAVVIKVRKKGLDLKYTLDDEEVKRVPMSLDLGRCGGTSEEAVSSETMLIMPTIHDPVLCDQKRGHRLGSSGSCISERVAIATKKQLEESSMEKVLESSDLTEEQFSALVASKYSNSVCAPGEAVGSIAAQSIGEPSTQMTLNTFHLAGSGANVTLGIPRLREIIMTASRELKTPTMSVPLLPFVSEKKALRLTRDFTKLPLIQLISGEQGVCVTERLERSSGSWERAYYVTLRTYPAKKIKKAFGLSLHDVAKVVSKNLVPLISQNMKKELRRSNMDGTGVADVFGGESTEYKQEDSPAPEEGRDATPDQDELGDEDEDDDDDDEMNEEDGVDSSRKNQDSYGGRDEDEESDEDETPRAKSDVIPKPTPATDASVLDTRALKTSVSANEKEDSIVLPPLRVDPATRPLLMVGIVEKSASSTIVHAKMNISEAYVNEEKGRGRCFQTAGVNFAEMWKLEGLDHNKLMSNDIWAVRCAYGVEAARNNIVNQITSVFGAYGIEVDPRHLSLIADYMTFDGGFKAMNRIGIEDSSSTLLQMSFETTVHFLRQAAVSRKTDFLNSPSANIVLGRPIRHGTGAFDVLAKVS